MGLCVYDLNELKRSGYHYIGAQSVEKNVFGIATIADMNGVSR